MKTLTVNQIRDKFLDFFVKKQHHFLPSFSLVPQEDKSLLLINSGMAPMKAFFTGQAKPPSSRVVTCQKCIRTIDIDEVGKDARHGSFFEMLGNFSFGDYFKKEIIPWAWEFMTVEMEIPTDKLSVSVYENDDEAFDIWHKTVGLPAEKIFRLGKADNYWELGVGPCGPCSEIYFDRGEQHGCGSADCQVGCDCDRFMEIWNLVFTQFEKQEDGSYLPLASTNIDTGMGLERLAIVMQNAPSIFDIDNIKSIRDKVLGMSKETKLVSANIIADHVRSVVFMAADGVLPSNEGRGYVFRRLLRRAVRHGKAMGLTGFVCDIAKIAIDAYSHAYPNLAEKSSHIIKVLGSEESRFLETLDTGMSLLQKQIDALKAANKSTLSGADGFKLYDTFGFPPDLTREILQDVGLCWDEAGFADEMQAQKTRAREARGTTTYMGTGETVYNKLPPSLPTEFCGYEKDSCEAKILAMLADGEIVQKASEGGEVAIVLDVSPFYAASGGQKGDKGRLSHANCEIEITDCITVAGNNTAHIGVVKSGEISVGEAVTAIIDTTARRQTERNHTAAHLLQNALRAVLGDHVEQAGSSVDSRRVRFDFTHMSPLTPSEREKIEALVCEYIARDLAVTTEETTPDQARAKGAIALFGEKYGDTVRLVNVANESLELCGGTHVKNTATIGLFRILSETGIASGVRRIEAETGTAALERFRNEASILAETAEILKTSPSQLPEKVKTLFAENRELKKEIAKIQAEKRGGAIEDILSNAEEHKGFRLIAVKLENYDTEALRDFCDKLKAKMQSGCMLLCGVNAETNAAQFLASATDDAVKQGINAGQIVKQAASLCGGGGGGKPNHAQAGGKDASRADEALSQALSEMKKMLG
ncbi:MAG: alanine--tRNA ligase [Defluviitaleaceae bacterium]|nr:alanine--tRNA ligase [Defluviitaleaceae bacterium]